MSLTHVRPFVSMAKPLVDIHNIMSSGFGKQHKGLRKQHKVLLFSCLFLFMAGWLAG